MGFWLTRATISGGTTLEEVPAAVNRPKPMMPRPTDRAGRQQDQRAGRVDLE